MTLQIREFPQSFTSQGLSLIALRAVVLYFYRFKLKQVSVAIPLVLYDVWHDIHRETSPDATRPCDRPCWSIAQLARLGFPLVVGPDDASKGPAKVLGQEGVQQRIDAAVQVSDTGRDNLTWYDDRSIFQWTQRKVLNDHDDVQRQPAHGEHDDNNNYHPSHASVRPHPLGPWVAAAADRPLQQAPEHHTVQEADGYQRQRVGEREEATVEEATIIVLRCVNANIHTDRSHLVPKLVVVLLVLQEYGHVEEEYGCPQRTADQVRVTFRADRKRPDGVNHGEVTIEGHEDEGVDADVGGRLDQVLVDLAPGVSEGPVLYGVAEGRERYADDDEDEVGDGEVCDQDVRRVARQLTGQSDGDDEYVADGSEDGDDAEDDRNEATGDEAEQLIARIVVVIGLVERRPVWTGHGVIDDDAGRVNGHDCVAQVMRTVNDGCQGKQSTHLDQNAHLDESPITTQQGLCPLMIC